jgi:2-dehydro-3-deoxy-D-gluconate 5-dehydrogenase
MSLDLFSLTGNNVLITGASRGIGRACALALANAGARICVVTRDGKDDYDDLRATGAQVDLVQADLSDMDQVSRIFGQALEKMGGEIHVLVNCAGIQRRAPALEFSLKDWNEVKRRQLQVPC